LGSGIAVIGICFFVFRAPGSQALLQGPLWLYLLPLSVVPFGLAISYWGDILLGMNRILLTNFVELGTKVVSVALVIVFVVWLRFDVAGAVWADFMTRIGLFVFYVVLLSSLRILGRPSFDSSLWRQSKRIALPAYFGSIMGYLNYRADQFILAALLPPEQLGFYVIAVDLAERLWVLTGSVAMPLLPHLTNSPKRDPEFVAIVSRHVMLCVALACILLFILADVIVKILYSSVFSESVAPLRWLLPGILLATPGKLLIAEMLAREKLHFIWLASIAVPVNIVCNFILIPRMGISGAAIASSISYSLLSVIVVWCYLRETGLSWKVLIPCRNDLHVYVALLERLRAKRSLSPPISPV
jgi:O-antigen/teichoic acid export membrane protein